jgi:hypothetical protein
MVHEDEPLMTASERSERQRALQPSPTDDDTVGAELAHGCHIGCVADPPGRE